MRYFSQLGKPALGYRLVVPRDIISRHEGLIRIVLDLSYTYDSVLCGSITSWPRSNVDTMARDADYFDTGSSRAERASSTNLVLPDMPSDQLLKCGVKRIF